jgi:hypothetical protein
MKRRDVILLTCLLAAGGLVVAGAAVAQEAESAIDPVEKYQGFAEDNPDVVDDRGNGLPVEGPARTEEELGTEGVKTYPDVVAEDHPSLRPDAPETEPPYSEETDVHGAFGEGNPDVQR